MGNSQYQGICVMWGASEAGAMLLSFSLRVTGRLYCARVQPFGESATFNGRGALARGTVLKLGKLATK